MRQEIGAWQDPSGEDLSSFETAKKSPAQELHHILHSNQAAVPLIVLVASVGLFGVLDGNKFFSVSALSVILQQVAITGIIGAAQTLVILSAGIDLSVGSIMTLSSVVMGQFAFRYGFPVSISILCGFGLAAGCGWINGVLVARMRLPAFIVTFGTWQVYSAATYIFTGGESIRGADIDENAPLLVLFGISIRVAGASLTLGVASMILLVCLLWYILNFTAWGRRIYAMGDDKDAAILSGVPVPRMMVTVYTVSGLISALAGWVMIGRIHSVAPTVGEFANIEAITAAVIGGVSLSGGRGSVLGMLFGALVVGVISLGLDLYGSDAQWTYLSIGVFIIVAVSIDQWIKRVGQ